MEYGGSEITHVSWGSRVKNSIVGAFIGILLFFGSFALLGWNEARSVAEIRALNECSDKLVSVDCTANSLSNGALVHIACPIPDIPTWTDSSFNVTATGVGLKRIVQMLQWEETSSEHCTKDSVGGGKTCKKDYHYHRAWRSDSVNSGGFFNSAYRNPDHWELSAATYSPQDLHAGNYSLPKTLTQQVVDCSSSGCSAPVPLFTTPADLPVCATSPVGACAWSLTNMDGDDYYYLRAFFEPGGVGDLRVRFVVSTAQAVSVIAVQQPLGGQVTFAPYYAQSGHQCFLLDIGLVPPQQMLQEARDRNTVATWLIRFGGLFMMWFGQVLFLSPVAVAIDIIPFVGPFVGDLVEWGASAIAIPVALMCSFFTISVAWIAVRPAIGVPLLLTSFCLAVAIVLLRDRKRREKDAVDFSGMGSSGPSGYVPPTADGWYRVPETRQYP